jgi:hypothetical protein
MRRVLSTVFVAALLLSSCAEYSENVKVQIEKTDVNFAITTTDNLSVNKSAAGGGYDRSNAPVYVKGVDLTYNHTGISETTGTTQFLFDATGGDAISMQIPMGVNEFNAISLPTYDAANNTYTDLVKSESTSAEGNVFYSTQLVEKQPIYAIFTGDTNPMTITTQAHDVAIAMTTTHARYSVVLETSANYDIEMTVAYADNSNTVRNIDSESASAILLNDAALVGENDLTITLKVYAHGNTTDVLKTMNVLGNNNVVYKTVTGFNNTLVLRYNENGTLQVVETGFTFTWTPMGESGEVVNID